MSLAEYRFLIADDHLLLRQTVSKVLGEMSVKTIDWAMDGQDTIEKIRAAYDAGAPYSIVCLDWNMPKLTGLEVMRLCRQDRRFDNMAIVMVTAESEENNIMRAIEEVK